MALQGTLDTFALTDVLRLLAATHKTGRLVIDGDRGAGSIWVHDGAVVAAEPSASPSGDLERAVVGHLRHASGSFSFEAGATAPDSAAGGTAALDVAPLLEAAEELLAELRAIEEVVPSLHVGLRLAPEIQQAQVTIDQRTWRVLARLGGRSSPAEVADAEGLDEVDALRLARDLIDQGLVHVDPAAPAGPAPGPTEVPSPRTPIATSAPADAAKLPPPGGGWVETPPLASLGLSEEFEPQRPAPAAEPFAGRSTAPAEEAVEAPPPPRNDRQPADLSFGALIEQGVGAAGHWPGDAAPSGDDAAEIAQQLANLSPRAAKAVAAAARATSDEEREAALAAIEAEDDTVNRSLLLRFLGSVDS